MLTINKARLVDEIEELAQLGRTPAGGVSRPAFSELDVAGRAWFRERVLAAGLDFRQDGAGNLSAVLPAAQPDALTLMAGSHLDSVIDGGRYDGSLGTLAALEALRTIKEAQVSLPVHLEAISFTDEEGSVMTLFGSQALIGRLMAAHFERARGGPAVIEAGLARLGITRDSALSSQRDPSTLTGFVEVHIEQGTRLLEAGLDIGVVTSIVGIRSAWLRFQGQAAHAGTMPMPKRADAFWGAAEFAQRAKTLVMDRFTPGVMNCGQIEVGPGAFNIVPATANLALEFRHGTEAQLDEMEEVLFSLAQEIAVKNGLTLEIERAGGCEAAPMADQVVQAIEQAADNLGLGHKRLMSFAGHDAQSMSAITPSGMIFVPSIDGISHNPRELSLPEHLINGANTLLHTLLILAGAG